MLPTISFSYSAMTMRSRTRSETREAHAGDDAEGMDSRLQTLVLHVLATPYR
jgi:hypothetical protein